MFSLEELNVDGTDKVTQETESGETGISQNGILATAWEALKAAIRFKVTKGVLFLIVVPVFLFITGDFTKSVNIADDISTKGANEDYFGLLGAFAKEKKHKSTKLNMHPVYHTIAVRKLEHAFELKYGYPISFKKLFTYAIYKEQEFLVMKKAVRDKKARKNIKMELSTVFGVSANDYCEDNFEGFVMNEELRKEFVSIWGVSKIKDELTKDNDDGKKFFRCVIDSDTIEDYLDD